MKKILSIVTVIAIIAMMSTGMCFAATQDVPVKLTAPAISDAGIDFSVNAEGIKAEAATGTTTLTYDDLKITNNATVGQIKLDSVSATAETGWTLKADDADYFKGLKADTKEFSMVTEGQDLSEAAKTYTDNKIAAGAEITVSFTGNIGTFTEAITATQIAKVVPTVSIF